MQTTNPFQTILDELGEVKDLLHSLKKEPEIELKRKFYSIKECSDILKLDYQTVRSHILKGNIKAEQIGTFPHQFIKIFPKSNPNILNQ